MTDSSSKIFPDEIIADVQRTWSLMNSDLEMVGVDVLLRLFTKYPTYQFLFDNFKDIPREELNKKPEFLKHATSVANALDSAVVNLNDPDKLVQLLTRIGKSHIKRSVSPEHFGNIQPVILEAIEETLKDKITEQELSSWNEVLAVAVSAIMKGATG